MERQPGTGIGWAFGHLSLGAALLGFAVLSGCGGKDSPTGPSLNSILGTWDVLYVKEISLANASVTETVCCSGFSVRETCGADGSWSSTSDDGSESPVVVTGNVAIQGDSIYFTFDEPGIPVYDAWLSISQGIMTQRHPTQWDFDGNGVDEPAVEEYRYAQP